jgi:FKBP-type peptidyl-prolyl cis-trans isomerase
VSAVRAGLALGLASAAALACASCGLLGPGRPPDETDPAVSSEPREQHAVEAPEGTVAYDEILPGEGRAAAIGDALIVDYTAWLADGQRVDSTLDRGAPIGLVLGQAFVRGLDLGLEGARPGSRRRINVPSGLAYGSGGAGSLIPADADLVFEVQVHEVRPAAP